ncbi:ACP S-malonyltransferase [Actinomadura sp. 9N215]|uniref:ACP S-malonyltransferase n=1 Tax=Actinomadura sp. 9N215 TaxID=3375150 RepID=UPI0037A64929
MGGMAFLFPGQGSQKPGMGKDLVARYPYLRARYFDAADEILGRPLSRMCFEGDAEELNRTENTQPAVFVVSMAILDVLRAAGLEPDAVAGHSLGEYSALVCAGALDFPAALRLVDRRGTLMSQVNAANPGAMAALIGVPADRVGAICAEARLHTGEVVEPANFNEPEQTVVSGTERGVDHAMRLGRDAGARVVRLRVGAPFHCSLMSQVAERFAADLEAAPFTDPDLPVIANVTAAPLSTARAARQALVRQIASPVRWSETMRLLVDDGCRTFVEVGPGRALSGFAMKIAPDVPVHSTGQARRVDKLLEHFEMASVTPI